MKTYITALFFIIRHSDQCLYSHQHLYLHQCLSHFLCWAFAAKTLCLPYVLHHVFRRLGHFFSFSDKKFSIWLSSSISLFLNTGRLLASSNITSLRSYGFVLCEGGLSAHHHL